jgi:hypothetical protein
MSRKKQDDTLTTLLPRARLFRTGSLAVPVSRFLCERLLDELEIIERPTGSLERVTVSGLLTPGRSSASFSAPSFGSLKIPSDQATPIS